MKANMNMKILLVFLFAVLNSGTIHASRATESFIDELRFIKGGEDLLWSQENSASPSSDTRATFGDSISFLSCGDDASLYRNDALSRAGIKFTSVPGNGMILKPAWLIPVRFVKEFLAYLEPLRATSDFPHEKYQKMIKELIKNSHLPPDYSTGSGEVAAPEEKAATPHLDAIATSSSSSGAGAGTSADASAISASAAL
jgi:hypothetical protein